MLFFDDVGPKLARAYAPRGRSGECWGTNFVPLDRLLQWDSDRDHKLPGRDELPWVNLTVGITGTTGLSASPNPVTLTAATAGATVLNQSCQHQLQRVAGVDYRHFDRVRQPAKTGLWLPRTVRR